MPLKYSNLRKLRISFFCMNKTASIRAWHKDNLDEINKEDVLSGVRNRHNKHLISCTFSDKARKEELVSSVSLFCIKEHIFVIEEEPLSGMCRQLHQMLPCMKSQLVVIDKFPNTSKDFSNYLSPLLKLYSCISFFPPILPFFLSQGYVRAGKYAREGGRARDRERRDKEREGKRERERGRERETACRIGVLDIWTDSIHLSPPGVPMGRASLLVVKP